MKVNDLLHFGNDEKGATLLEAALTMLPFFLLLLIVVQSTVVGYTALSISYSLSVAGREAALSTGTTSDASRVNRIVNTTKTQAGKLGIDTRDMTFRTCPLLNLSCSGSEPGGGNQFVHIEVTKPVRLFSGLGVINVSSSLLAKNEPV